MNRTNWFKKAIVYQIYPRSFKDSNNDGFGDINGIISKLDYLKELGVNTVWLSPIYDSPQKDNGYDISNYKDIYKPFGTLEDAKRLIKEMHKRDIKLVMDLVVNHTSSEHKWFKSVVEDPSSPYKDYYIIRKGKKNGKKPPNNWSGFFGEKAWEKLPGSEDEYYLHLFAKGQPDLNWENPKLREEIKDILRFWLDLGVDGFRCDVITLISKKQDFKSRFPSIALCGKDAYVNGPRLHEYLHELYKDVYVNYDTMTVGESVLSTLKDAIKLVAPEREELDMIFNFDHTDVDNYLGVKYFYRKFSLRRFKRRINHWQVGLYNKGWNSLFIENHDQRRSVGRFGTIEGNINSSKCLAATYFLLQGTPFIYQGQEIGMSNAHFKSMDEIKDVELQNISKMIHKIPFGKRIMNKVAFDVSRDNARTPMCWDDSKYAGFSESEPWIRVNSNKDEINVKKALEDKDSLFYFYKKLIELRKTEPLVETGKFHLLSNNNPHIFAYERIGENEKLVVISNFSNKERHYKKMKKMDFDDIVLSNYDRNDYTHLKPFEVRVYKIKK